MDVGMAWWAATLFVVVALLAVDLAVSGRQQRPPSVREATLWVAGYCTVALIFGAAVTVGFGREYGGQFLAGWVTEYSLSVDNLFVFLVLMARFAVPRELQLKVLTIGIVLALALRAVMITVGAAAIARFSWVFIIFGAFLLWTAWGLLRGGAESEPSGEPNRLVQALERWLPTTDQWHGGRFLAKAGSGWVITPMFLTMVAIGTTDVLFALDSIPAIFGLTREPFLVIAANAFALMGLRQLYFLVGGLMEKLPLLGTGLSLVLAFIGVKLIAEALRENSLPFVNGGRPVEAVPHVPVSISLGVVVGTLLTTTLIGLLLTARRARAAVSEA